MNKRLLQGLTVGLLVVLPAACATAPVTVRETKVICPVALTGAELTRAADAIDELAAVAGGPALDYLAGLIERFDDATMECRR